MLSPGQLLEKKNKHFFPRFYRTTDYDDQQEIEVCLKMFFSTSILRNLLVNFNVKYIGKSLSINLLLCVIPLMVGMLYAIIYA